MLKKTKRKIVLALAAVLAAGSVAATAGKAAAAQYSSSVFQSICTEKLLYCETDYDITDAKYS